MTQGRLYTICTYAETETSDTYLCFEGLVIESSHRRHLGKPSETFVCFHGAYDHVTNATAYAKSRETNSVEGRLKAVMRVHKEHTLYVCSTALRYMSNEFVVRKILI